MTMLSWTLAGQKFIFIEKTSTEPKLMYLLVGTFMPLSNECPPANRLDQVLKDVYKISIFFTTCDDGQKRIKIVLNMLDIFFYISLGLYLFSLFNAS